MDIIERILQKPRLIKSYYYGVNLVIVINAAEKLYAEGKKPCIINFDKIKWEFYPYEIKFKMFCDNDSENLVFEAEKVSEIPLKFRLVTSAKVFNINCDIATVERIGNNLYKILLDGEVLTFQVKEGKLTERAMNRIDEEILNLLNENGGTMTVKELVDIISFKLRVSKDYVRNELAFLKTSGKVEIEKSTVKLIG
ncbi:hypothetical protein WIW89_08350 [Stygiolobus sp. CP850M]|jgi:hypothetical protein|uniref:hypothetical protein n=1 Tax=unclassified Stygiolobus TaxID=2824672 RepID=UPI0028CCFE43|nr:hypothetical protein [Sulfolobaceae archaeon]